MKFGIGGLSDTLYYSHKEMESNREHGVQRDFTTYTKLLDDMDALNYLSPENAVSILNDQFNSWQFDFNSKIMTVMNFFTLSKRRLQMIVRWCANAPLDTDLANSLAQEQNVWTQLMRDERIDADSVGQIIELIYKYNSSHGNLEPTELKKL